jgi:hypothetical protein
MTSILTEVEDGLGTWIDDLRARADQLEQHFRPVIHDGAVALERMSQSPIVSELMQLGEGALPESTEAAIVAIIRDAGTAAAKVAELTAPPPAPEEPAQPEPQQ